MIVVEMHSDHRRSSISNISGGDNQVLGEYYFKQMQRAERELAQRDSSMSLKLRAWVAGTAFGDGRLVSQRVVANVKPTGQTG